MEYQTIITLGTHPFRNLPPLDGWREAEVVAVHELGHNYWQGQIASNEVEEPWLDEGLNTYYEALIMDSLLGGAADVLGAHASSLEMLHLVLTETPYTDPVVQAAWSYLNGGAYFSSTYFRAAAVLAHLERLLTPEVFHRAMRRFFTDFRFRHPSTADFERAMSEAADRDLGWFFAQALHDTVSLDLAVRSATTRVVQEPEGYFWDAGPRRLVEPPADDAVPDGSREPGTATRTRYQSVVVVERRGDFRHPATVAMRFADGAEERREWDGRARWVRLVVEGDARLVSAEVDPDHVLFLDCNRVNNSLLLEPEPRGVHKMLIHVLFWIQNGLSLTAGLG